jgi:arsenite methyltransferase
MSTSLKPLTASDSAPTGYVQMPPWFWDYLRVGAPPGAEFKVRGQNFVMTRGIPRSQELASGAQAQTEEAFGFKWQKRDTFDSPVSLARAREWLIARYGDPVGSDWFKEHGESPVLLDAGCGAAVSAIELFAGLLPRVRYIGADISEAVDVAAERFRERGIDAAFIQADLTKLPFPEKSVDLILSEGVLHHTDSTEGALGVLSRLLKPGGRFLFYVYRKKGPLREFSDDYIRAQLQSMTPADAWKAVEPLTQLGIALGKLEAEIEIETAIDVLGIPAGKIDVQRLFYWHVAKAFYPARPEFR